MSVAEKIEPKVKTKKKALICEDNPDFNDLMQEFLTDLGFEVLSCGDGMQASNALKREIFDLIFLDIRVPSLNGLQVCAIARAHEINRNAKIYIITGEMDPTIAAKAAALRVNRFLKKPCDLGELRRFLTEDFSKQDKNVKYDVRIINAFIDAAAEVYDSYFQEKPARGKVGLRPQGGSEKGFCTALISLSGDGLVGSMGIGMTTPFVKKLATALFSNKNAQFDNEFVADVAGVLCNQILCKVKVNFEKLGINIDLGLPEVVMGKDHYIQHKVTNPVITVPLGTEPEVFELQFVLANREARPEPKKSIKAAKPFKIFE